ncbi:MAG: hypothetical protein IV107_24010 [Paucibacter sp.]|nr:hypothetical protein [Roseateles sp.]
MDNLINKVGSADALTQAAATIAAAVIQRETGKHISTGFIRDAFAQAYAALATASDQIAKELEAAQKT